MTTVVNNPPSNNDSGGMGMIIGLIVLLALGFLFFWYGLPAIRSMQSSGTQINVPSQVDINVKQSE